MVPLLSILTTPITILTASASQNGQTNPRCQEQDNHGASSSTRSSQGQALQQPSPLKQPPLLSQDEGQQPAQTQGQTQEPD